MRHQIDDCIKYDVKHPNQDFFAENIVGVKKGQHTKKTILLFAHIDTEKAPYNNYSEIGLLKSDDRYYGHGIADSKSGIVIILMVLKILNKLNYKLNSHLLIGSLYGKMGGKLGTGHLFSELDVKPDLAVYCHPPESGNGLLETKLSSVAVLPFHICVSGRLPLNREINNPETFKTMNGINAIDLSAEIIIRLLHSQVKNKVHINIGKIKGGTGAGIVAEDCLIEGKVFVKKKLGKAFFETQFNDIINGLFDEKGYAPNIVTVYFNENYSEFAEMSAHSNILPIFEASAQKVLANKQLKVSEYNNHLSSDIRFPLNLDIPSIGMGPKGGGFYGDKEWVNKQEFYHSIDILLEFILKWDKS